MNADDFESRMRRLEVYHELRVIPETWVVIRVDGRGFSKFTASRFEKPFDARFHGFMTKTATTLLEELQAVYAYTESDEISLLFRPNWNLFDRELEKLVSTSAGLASAVFSIASAEIAHFDARVWVGVNEQTVLDYFRWRQADAARCALNGWAYWTLRNNGESSRKATAILERQSTDFKHELLFQNGINFNDLPLWQRRGVGVYWESYVKDGFNPVSKKSVNTQRRRIKINDQLPLKDDYSAFLFKILNSG